MRSASTLVFAVLAPSSLASCGFPSPTDTINGTLLCAVVLDLGTDAANVTASQYDQYFAQASALDGVQEVIAAGQFYINQWAIPGREVSFQNNSQCSQYGYLVNQVPWLYYNTTTASFWGGYEAETEGNSYKDAALSVAMGIVAGLEVRLWDTNGDGYTDLIDADYLQGVTVETITQNSNDSYSIYRGNIDVANETPYEGAIFDGQLFNGPGPSIPAENFDTSIAPGDIALFWYGRNRWVMKRPLQVTGLFVDGADHESYKIDGTIYEDAMRFSRDNIFISNRPGEFTDAQKFFGFMNDSAAGLSVSLWLVPVTDANRTGGPIGMTGNGDSDTFLAKAIDQAQAVLNNVTVSFDGSDVSSAQTWVTQTDHGLLEDAIARAKSALSDANSSSFLLDYQTYVLYQALNGSSTDIGAAFAGFSFPGFENDEQNGTAY